MSRNFHLKPAVREDVNVIIGLASASGGGKTYTALELAMGLAGGGKIGMIDTEARRGLHYAEYYKYEHIDFVPPFNPESYSDAIDELQKRGCKVGIIDSASHAHAGDGGMLDMHEAELYRLAKDDYTRRASCNMLAWVKPKTEHKKFVQKMLQYRMHIIFCFRAEEKVKMTSPHMEWKLRKLHSDLIPNGEKFNVPEPKGKDDKKTKIIPLGWQPICEKNLPYEMTVSFILAPDNPGVPIPVKLQEQHKHIFPLDKKINRECGVKLAEWAKGTKAEPKPKKLPTKEEFAEIVSRMKSLDSLTKTSTELNKNKNSYKETDVIWMREKVKERQQELINEQPSSSSLELN